MLDKELFCCRSSHCDFISLPDASETLTALPRRSYSRGKTDLDDTTAGCHSADETEGLWRQAKVCFPHSYEITADFHSGLDRFLLGSTPWWTSWESYLRSSAGTGLVRTLRWTCFGGAFAVGGV